VYTLTIHSRNMQTLCRKRVDLTVYLTRIPNADPNPNPNPKLTKLASFVKFK